MSLAPLTVGWNRLCFSDDFRGNRNYLIRLNWLNVRSEIWRPRLRSIKIK